jgi:serine/threonine protein kinase
LNHPNICTLYDVGPEYLVMEFIEGMTLAERIAQGPITLAETLNIAKQIVEALNAAHERHIVHRDLKPANIKLRPDGSVKVLDFGLARTELPSQEAVQDSRTLTAQTEPGMLLGTAGYMSPEQARGHAVDKRTDIWAFGVIVYEMSTGKRPFHGESIADTLAATLNQDPDLRLVPQSVRRLVGSCLEKDPKKRLRDIGDWTLLLDDDATVENAGVKAKVFWATVPIVLLLAATALTLYVSARKATAPETFVDIATPPTADPASFALSPDGRSVVFTASSQGPSRLWIRSLDSATVRPLPDTEGASNPFWSPDGRSLGFYASSRLKRIDLAGEKSQVLAEAAIRSPQAAWSDDGVILFTSRQTGALISVPASGGPTTAVTRLVNHRRHFAPRFLPGSRKFLFAASGAQRELLLGSLNGEEPKRIATLGTAGDSAAEYLKPGWIVRVRQNSLIAQHFDAERGELTGSAITLAESVGVDPGTMAGAFSVSPSGTIAWRTGIGRRQLTWVDRSGKEGGTLGPPNDNTMGNPELSPDGRRAGITVGNLGAIDIWIQDDARASRFTFDAAEERYTVWSPDGKRVAFASNRNGKFDLYMKLSDGTGHEELLLQSTDNKHPTAWAPNGEVILYVSDQNRGDLMVLPVAGERKPHSFLSTTSRERQGRFSPNGRMVAYVSDTSGRDEVYVRHFSGSGGLWQVSVDGGTAPRWRADGKELYFLTPDETLMAVETGSQGNTFTAGAPKPLFQPRIVAAITRPPYDVARDGRFLINSDVREASTEPIHLLLNWKLLRR